MEATWQGLAQKISKTIQIENKELLILLDHRRQTPSGLLRALLVQQGTAKPSTQI